MFLIISSVSPLIFRSARVHCCTIVFERVIISALMGAKTKAKLDGNGMHFPVKEN